MVESLLVSNSDILFMILSFLPADALLRAKLVCRGWAQVISDPAFIRAHSSRPTPITSFFKMRLEPGQNPIQAFKPLQEGAKFPTSIRGILSNGFKAVSSSHGLLCFRRNSVFIVGNPAISHWCVLQFAIRISLFMFHGAVLIYDPAVSTHFKLAVVLIKLDNREARKHYIQFNIYSSETSSWTVSSLFTQCWTPGICEVYRPCKIGGGSICWLDEFESLVGYEISTDTYWKASLPPGLDDTASSFLSSYICTNYFSGIGEGVAKVWRLEGKDSWVLEGEGENEELRHFVPTQFAYDPARGALILGGGDNGECFALHLSSSRLEILSHGPEFQPPPWELYDHPIEPHANTLAPLHGAETGLNGLARGFRTMGLITLDL